MVIGTPSSANLSCVFYVTDRPVPSKWTFLNFNKSLHKEACWFSRKINCDSSKCDVAQNHGTNQFCDSHQKLDPVQMFHYFELISVPNFHSFYFCLLGICLFTQQNSYSVRHLLGTVTTWLGSDCVVTVDNCWKSGGWAANGSVVIVTVEWLCAVGDWWKRSFAV